MRIELYEQSMGAPFMLNLFCARKTRKEGLINKIFILIQGMKSMHVLSKYEREKFEVKYHL